jgi:outer membrane protein assembly factor BamE (lipoprotein component of BamABCDE complex)
MRKRLLILAGVGLAVAVTAGVGLGFRARDQRFARLARGRLIDREHSERIKVGMNRDEVEAILGGPPGDFTTVEFSFVSLECGIGVVGHRREHWKGDQGLVGVDFDGQGKVAWRWFDKGILVPEPSSTERVRGWLGVDGSAPNGRRCGKPHGEKDLWPPTGRGQVSTPYTAVFTTP